MPDHVPTFRCRNRGGLTAGALVALWVALCAGFVAATTVRPTSIAGRNTSQAAVTSTPTGVPRRVNIANARSQSVGYLVSK